MREYKTVNWTTERPTKAGIYWFKNENNFPTKIKVSSRVFPDYDDPFLGCGIMGNNNLMLAWEPIKDIEGFWGIVK